MQSNSVKYTAIRLVSVLLAALLLSGCRTMVREHLSEHAQKVGGNPPIQLTLAPTNTPTTQAEAVATAEATPTAEATAAATATPTDAATATATDSATALPTATQAAATATQQPTAPARAATARPTAQPTPIVVIPNGFTKQTDSVRGYSLALPRGYTILDLRSAQFRNLAGAVGMGGQMATLTEFLDSDAGQIVGILAASDLAGMIFGGLPTIAQVMVVDARGASQDTAQTSVQAILTGQGAFLTNPVIETLENATINNLPGVRATVTGTLPGNNRPMAGQVVGLLANEKFYVLIQLTEASKLTTKAPIFAQIAGSFRPE